MELSTNSQEPLKDLKTKIKDAVKENSISDTLLSEIKTTCQKNPDSNNIIHSYLNQLFDVFQSNSKVSEQASVNKIKEYLVSDDLLRSAKKGRVSDTFEILEPGYDSDENTPGETPTDTPVEETAKSSVVVAAQDPNKNHTEVLVKKTESANADKELEEEEDYEKHMEEQRKRREMEEHITRQLEEEEEMLREIERIKIEKVQMQRRLQKEEKERRKREEEERKRLENERKHQEKEQRKREEERAKQLEKERKEQEKERKEQEKEQRKREEEIAKQLEKERKQQQKEQRKREEERVKQFVKERREHEKKLRKREEQRSKQLENERRQQFLESPSSQEQIDIPPNANRKNSRTAGRQEIELDIDVFKNLFAKVSPKSCGKSPFELGKQVVMSDLVDYAFIGTNVSELTQSDYKKIEQSICAFLNTRGGVIYFGVDRKGVTVGDTSGMVAYQKFAMKLAFMTEDGIIPALTNKNQIKMDILSVHGADKCSVGMIIVKQGKPNKLYCTSKGNYYFMKDQVMTKYSPQEVQNMIAKNAVDAYVQKTEKKPISTNSTQSLEEKRGKDQDPSRQGEGFIVWEGSFAPKGTWVPSNNSSRKGSISRTTSSVSSFENIADQLLSQTPFTPPKTEQLPHVVQTEVTHPQFSLMSILNMPQPQQNKIPHPVGYPLPNSLYPNVFKPIEAPIQSYPKGKHSKPFTK